MPSILHGFNYLRIIIDNNGQTSSPSVTGNRVPAISANGQVRSMPVGGFIEIEDISNRECYTLQNIIGWSEDDDGIGGWHDLPKNKALQAIMHHEKLFILVSGGEPVFTKA
ncbi:hypothetical protein K0504_10170 [Neiella marina]|uniref:Uncharacterized protein n=1 Tax=Neiella holothuriorum TaxID=2870530 RepID=A0ABS7EGD7_9GAMM|nr:hypothetical protein [Neiella holothuriorum]MBW8191404.1 hypothetical protein [Neiella holothuriorum]